MFQVSFYALFIFTVNFIIGDVYNFPIFVTIMSHLIVIKFKWPLLSGLSLQNYKHIETSHSIQLIGINSSPCCWAP